MAAAILGEASACDARKRARSVVDAPLFPPGNPTPILSVGAGPDHRTFRFPMSTDVIDNILSVMTPDEVEETVAFVNNCESWGTMTRAEAAQWRRRIEVRRAFPGLGEHDVSG